MSTSIDISFVRTIPNVQTHADLPSASLYINQLFWVRESTGTKWLPGSMGGTYYPKGLYYSDGSSWEWRKSPYQATLSEVNAGTNDDKFITPLTLQTSDLATKFNWTFDLTDALEYTVYAPQEISIGSVNEQTGTATITITVNGATYTLGDPISIWDEIKVSSDINTVLNLNITKL